MSSVKPQTEQINRESGLGHCLDGWRVSAAFMVVLTHVVNLAYPEKTTSIFLKTMNGMGRPAVVLFFVLSGYLVGGAVRRSVAKKWGWKKYLLARGIRLYVVLIPALIMGGVWDTVGLRILANADWYSGVHRAVIESRLHVPDFVANMLFLQESSAFFPKGHVFNVWGSNTALWSLCNEFWYYLLFPIALLVAGKGMSLGRRALYAVLFLAIADLVGSHVLALSACWLVGAYIPGLRAPTWLGTSIVRWATAIGVLVAGAVLIAIPDDPSAVRSLVVASLFAVHLVALTTGKPAGLPLLLGRAFQSGAEVSYTLYLTHLPFLILVWSFIGAGPATGTAIRILDCLLAVLAVIVYAVAMWALFERQTGMIRSTLDARLLKPTSTVG